MITKFKIDWVNDIIKNENPFKDNVTRNLKNFPADLDCPDEIKRWICGLASTRESLDFLLINRGDNPQAANLTEMINAKQWEKERQALHLEYERMIAGPSAF
ncbi:MAG: hypothetical protein COV44_09505 [Deltaproteobacteria bacterium CG11_big_fil_rev_8_21_14_0_20_45_16]|nr:MAG: hypothetical protein COV44_09505 [Deltaproteobacteria bacterium CG11_big_fil_rev_8_21_14_0_20_45_16]